MPALWAPRHGYPRDSTEQNRPADQKHQGRTGNAAEVQAKRMPEPELPKWAEDVLARPTPQSVYDEVMLAPKVSKVRPARVPTPWDVRVCDLVIRLRQEWELSQTQFARLCNVSLRTVKRWEAHGGRPMERTRTLLGIFVKNVERHGLEAFRERYVREEPRYHKSGPAHRLAENAFDSRVAGDSPPAFPVA